MEAADPLWFPQRPPRWPQLELSPELGPLRLGIRNREIGQAERDLAMHDRMQMPQEHPVEMTASVPPSRGRFHGYSTILAIQATSLKFAKWQCGRRYG